MAAVPPGQLLEAFPLPAILIDHADRIAAMNDGAQRLLNSALLGRHYITGLRQPDLLDAIEAVRSDGVARRTVWLGRSGARDTTWQAHVARADTMLLVSFEDRTVAEEASRMRRDFVADVSHELKTPLTALLGFIETLNGPARDDPKARQRFLGIMEGEARRMHRLVEDLLSLSRVEADERRRPTTPVDLHQILGSAVALLRPLAEERGVTVAYGDPGKLPPLEGDADQLRQVFANLVENALKYGGDRVELTVEADDRLEELRAPGVRVCVIDNGRGIDQIHLPRLTQRFYRVDAHRSRGAGGTGLGLAIVKHIVSRHRGRLRIESNPGSGSTFSIVLPFCTDRADP